MTRFVARVDLEVLRRMWEEGMDDAQIAAAFNVSRQAIHFRRMELGLPAQRLRSVPKVDPPPPPPPTIKPSRLSAEDTAALLQTGGRWSDLAALAKRKGWTSVKAQVEYHRARR